MSKIIETVRAARNVSVPVIAIQTPDQVALMQDLSNALGDQIEIGPRQQRAMPKVVWDRLNGMRGLNQAGREALAKWGGPADVGESTKYPEDALKRAEQLPEYAVVFMMNMHRFLDDAPVTTGVLNLRNPFKTTMRMLVMLGPAFRVPTELQHDVIVLDQPMPSSEELTEVVSKTYAAAKKSVPSLPNLETGVLDKAVNAVRGLATFDTEQVISMSLRKNGLDLDDAWERKRITINQTQGLTVARSNVTWADLGGHARLREFSANIRDGRETPICVFMLDEVEKMLAASGGIGPGDSSGVSQDQKGVLLRTMEDLGWVGLLAVGPPGTGKTAAGQAFAHDLGAEFVKGDFGGMKNSLVGASEQAVRESFRVVEGIGGSRVLVFATANELSAVTPDMRRRFWLGRWYFDLPDGPEKDAIWQIHLGRVGFDLESAWPERPDDTDWTGAEIRNCCTIAHRLGIPLKEAATYIVPVAKEMPEQVDRLRDLAHGRFLSTSYRGTYDKEKAPVVEAERRIGPRLVGVAAVFEEPARGPAPKGVEEVVGKKKGN